MQGLIDLMSSVGVIDTCNGDTCTGDLVEVKYCEDARPNNQLEVSRYQHKELCKST